MRAATKARWPRPRGWAVHAPEGASSPGEEKENTCGAGGTGRKSTRYSECVKCPSLAAAGPRWYFPPISLHLERVPSPQLLKTRYQYPSETKLTRADDYQGKGRPMRRHQIGGSFGIQIGGGIPTPDGVRWTKENWVPDKGRLGRFGVRSHLLVQRRLGRGREHG